jgi:hypothetical protein
MLQRAAKLEVHVPHAQSGGQLATPRFHTVLLAAFAGLAVLLTTIGLTQ